MEKEKGDMITDSRPPVLVAVQTGENDGKVVVVVG